MKNPQRLQGSWALLTAMAAAGWLGLAPSLGVCEEAAPPATASAEAKAHYEAGLKLKNAKALDQAAAELRQALAVDKDYADAHWVLAWVEALRKQNADAVLEFRELLRLEPEGKRAEAAKEALARLKVEPPAVAADVTSLLKEALTTAAKIQDPLYRGLAVATVRLWSLVSGDAPLAAKQFSQALAVCIQAQPDWEHPGFGRLARTFGSVAAVKPGPVLSLIGTLGPETPAWFRSLALSSTIAAMADREADQAAEALTKNLDAMLVPHRLAATKSVVRALGEADTAKAVAVAQLLGDADLVEQVQPALAAGVASRQPAEALNLAKAIKTVARQAAALGEVAAALAATQPAEARKLAAGILPLEDRAAALTGIAEVLAQAGSAEARGAFEEALGAVVNVGHARVRNQLLARLAATLAATGDRSVEALLSYLTTESPTAAEQALLTLPSPVAQQFLEQKEAATLSPTVAARLKAREEATEAVRWVRSLEDPREQCAALCAIAQAVLLGEEPVPASATPPADPAELALPFRAPAPPRAANCVVRAYGGGQSVRCLAASPDSMWVGTGNGVVRCSLGDDKPQRFGLAEGLPGAAVERLAVAHDGTVWALTEGGLAHFDGKTWESVAEVQPPGGAGKLQSLLVTTPDGKVWVLFARAAQQERDEGLPAWLEAAPGELGRLYVFAEGKWQRLPDDSTAALVASAGNLVTLLPAADGTLWAIASNGWWRLQGERWQRERARPWGATGAPESGVRCAAVDGTGRLWVGTEDSLWSCDGKGWKSHQVLSPDDEGYTPNFPPPPEQIAVAGDGTVWVGGHGVLVTGTVDPLAVRGVRWQKVPFEASVSADDPLGFDAQGGVWISGARFVNGEQSPTELPTSSLEGARLVGLDADGAPWLVTENSLQKLAGQTPAKALPLPALTGVATHCLHSLVVDAAGVPWVFGSEDEEHAGSCDAWSWAEGKWSAVSVAACFHAPVAGPDNTVWGVLRRACEAPAPESVGIGRWNGKQLTVLPLATAETPEPTVRNIAVAADGTGWMATSSGLIRMAQQQPEVLRSAHGVLPEDDVRAVSVGADGTVWAGTAAGLAAFKDGDWEFFTAANSGLPCDTLDAVACAADGKVWVATANGLCSLDGLAWSHFEVPFRLTKLLPAAGGVVWGMTAGPSPLLVQVIPEGATDPGAPQLAEPPKPVAPKPPTPAVTTPTDPGFPRPEGLPPLGETLFSDDFTGDLSKWTQGGGTVQIEDNSLCVIGGPQGGAFPVAIMRQQFPQQRLAVEMVASSVGPPGDIGVNLGGYGVSLGGWGNARTVLFKLVQGQLKELAAKNIGVKPGAKYHCLLVRDGNTLSYYLNGKLLLQATDPELITGPESQRVMMVTFFEKHTHYDRVLVHALP